MAYLSLYRKYRSQSFEEVSGQEHVTRTLQNAVRTGKVAHAYLFCGPRGTGKTSTARLLAKALNCEQGPTPTPCNTCTACRQIAAGSYLDLKEIDAASNRGIDNFRDLRENVAYAPAQGRYVVWVIDEAHQVTMEAFNAFLKTLEEPPPHAIFVLATTEAHKIPATIVSRCQRFDFRRASLEQLRERVRYVAEQEGATIEPAALDLIAREANGGWRDALSLLEQVLAFCEGRITAQDVCAVLGTLEEEALHALAASVLRQDGAEVFRRLEAWIAEGKDPRQVLRDLTQHYRNLMLTAAGSPPPGDPAQAERLEAQAREYGARRLMAAIEVLAQAEREARWSEQPRLLLELALVRLMHPREPTVAGHPQDAAPAAAAPARSAGPVRRIPDSPFVDEPASSGDAAPGRAAAPERREPPLTVGDARAGRERDEELSAFFEASPRPQDAAPSSAPPGPAGPALRAAAAVDSGDAIDLLRRKWRLVREELKRDRKVHLHIYLADTQPERLEGEVGATPPPVLVIRFPSATMAEGFEKRGKEFSEPLAQAIERVTGICCRVRAEVGERSAAAPPGRSAGRTAPAPSPPARSVPEAVRPATPGPGSAGRAPADSDLTHEVIEIFDGQLLEEGDAPDGVG